MEHFSIDDFIRVEEHLTKKLTESCSEFNKLIMTKTCETFNGQLLSRDQFQRIYQNARQFVKDLFLVDCRVLKRFRPELEPGILKFCRKAFIKIDILHDFQWQILVSKLPYLR